ncbi:VWA domain-containing protein [Cellulomonas sp. S1-8]|uniref:VWA domain-containing protein n=1 Tax=Cellulomonas sp. S1-8 TaxID=2904790 RepID=UPI00224352CA|nr:VWA domain-containing protein [Cellulomonas sp. S1-8]UZN04250.1 VWA domain-containing protein [Cellulomonas sp. S1-8]
MRPTDRWRLVLGRYAEDRLPPPQDPRGSRYEAALDYLYGREYAGRGGRGDDGPGDQAVPGPGSLDPSAPSVVDWLGEVRELFPRESVETIERHALDRYGLTELVTDPEVLARIEPSEALLRTLLSLKGQLDPAVLGEVRRIVRAVVEDLRRRLAQEIHQALTGRVSQHRHSPHAVAANFDPRGTIRANLRHWDAAGGRLVVERPLFFQRNTRRIPWEVVLLVDQSGSMVGSVIHSAVMAGILSGLPAYRLRLVVFDTSVVDLTDLAGDPVELLMTVQLGGGTNIARAVTYAGQAIDNPARAVVVLVSDFCEGGPPSQLVAAVRRLVEARVTTIGLAALDGTAHPAYDRAMAQQLADVGMPVAALTPGKLAEWLAEVTAR